MSGEGILSGTLDLAPMSTTAAPPNEQMIEVVARRICAFHGIDPDAREHHYGTGFAKGTRYGIQWLYYRDAAIAGLIAAGFAAHG